MKYSLLAGGKRIRPVLLLATNEALGGTFDGVIDYAIALECIHTYSLIHDDLPAMDNDDYRRGKLSNHKKFDEATAILAGDALLNFAYETLFNKKDFNSSDLLSCRLLSEFAGAKGMIAGQTADMYDVGLSGIEEVDYIVKNKTAKLITAPLLIASIKNDNKYYDELKVVGEKLGTIFQITDDVLDKTGTLKSIGKTPFKDVDKHNYVNVLGMDDAGVLAKKLYDDVIKILIDIPNSSFLLKLVENIYYRKK
jgi:geranylgeranyl diphosphate synthase type II